jgi:hypothetical protein
VQIGGRGSKTPLVNQLALQELLVGRLQDGAASEKQEAPMITTGKVAGWFGLHRYLIWYLCFAI